MKILLKVDKDEEHVCMQLAENITLEKQDHMQLTVYTKVEEEPVCIQSD